MSSEIIFEVYDSPEGGFEASALGHSIFTEADTLDELRKNVREAVSCHFGSKKSPGRIRLHFVDDPVLVAA